MAEEINHIVLRKIVSSIINTIILFSVRVNAYPGFGLSGRDAGQ